MATGKKLNDSTLQATSTRKLLWDEENRLLGISDNGYVSNYWYDAAGERTVKQSGGSEGVFVNGVLSGARTETGKFTAYISPYMVLSNGGNYSKHIYMGSQRIVSKMSNSGIFAASPVTAIDQQVKYARQTSKIKERFDSLGVIYNGTPQTGGLVSVNPASTASSYFYHPDHLGSSSLITDGTGALTQHIQYVPFGEVFVEERTNSWSTPYKFNGKELDEETGLYYFHARYYDPRLSVWMSVDPLAEKKPWISSYVYCRNHPINFIDPDGMDEYETDHRGRTVKVAENTDKDIVYSLNKEGERVDSREFEYKSIKLSSAKDGNDNYYIIRISGDENAKQLFEFLTTPENFELKAGQNVEFGVFYTGIKGDAGVNFITTSQDLDADKAGTYLFDNQLKFGYTIRGHDHNHPNNDPTPSGTGGKGGDIAFIKKLINEGNVTPNAKFRIFTPGLKNKYHIYNSSSTVNLKEVIIRPTKKGK